MTAQLGPRRLGRKCWGDRHLDAGGSHPGLGICQLGNEQLPVQRGCEKGFDFLRLLSKWHRIVCTMWNEGVFLFISEQLFFFFLL